MDASENFVKNFEISNFIANYFVFNPQKTLFYSIIIVETNEGKDANMKKIINGKMYDTQTAEELEFYSNLANSRDFRYYEETLYRKKTGEFFLYGTGGAASKYAVIHVDRSRSGGAAIIPLTEIQAMLWVEEHSHAATYIEIFGEVEE